MDIKKQTKIVFMGTPTSASKIMKSLIDEGYQIVGLITQPDQRQTNNKVLEPETKQIAKHYQIPVYQPENIKIHHDFINEIKCDLIITVAYGQIVPQTVLDWPKLGCVNVHGSLLPMFRGAAPLQHALINGLTSTGITLTKMVLAMDSGPIYATQSMPIFEDDNYSSLLLRFTESAISLLKNELPQLLMGKLPNIQQDEQTVSYAPSIKSEQEHLDTSLELNQFINWIRALSDQPGGHIIHQSGKLKIFKAEIDNKVVTCGIGTIVKADKNGLLMQLKDGQIRLLIVQKEGRKRLKFDDFINGEQHLVGRVYY